MIIHNTSIDGVRVVDTSPVGDHRGSFARCFCQAELASVLDGRSIVQINLSRTARVGTIRGLHFQHPPHAEMKLIRCLRGRVLDVAVDLRAGSDSFLQWHAEELSAENLKMIVIPEGFAHGFQVLEPDSELLYLHTAMYYKSAEGAVRYDEPQLGISWPFAVTEISERDAGHAYLPAGFSGLSLSEH